MPSHETHVEEWKRRQTLAESMIPVIGALYRDRDVVITIHGRSLVNRSATKILKAHRFARRIDQQELRIEETAVLLDVIAQLPIIAAEIDLALLAAQYPEAVEVHAVRDLLRDELLSGAKTDSTGRDRNVDVVLYGFGRIGRLIARILIAQDRGDAGLRLRAIVVRRSGENDLRKRASLLRRDSVHGAFAGTIKIDDATNTIIANGVRIRVIYADDPAAIDYTDYGIQNAIVVDNTGRRRDLEGLEEHLKSAGTSRVLLTAPGEGQLKNIVFGINDDIVDDADRVITAGSCTTNAIVPVLRVINERFGIVHGHAETVHSYTNDQNLIDNIHQGDRRGRAAAMNLVITDTGAGNAVETILPELKGALTASAIRVPTPDVSLAILNLTLRKPTRKEEINEYLSRIALSSPLRHQIDFTDSPDTVSTDIIGSVHAGVVDGRATICDGMNTVIYVWYDNEFGYSSQVVRLLEKMSGIQRLTLPRSLQSAHAPGNRVMEESSLLAAISAGGRQEA